jgi:hypothetical protein
MSIIDGPVEGIHKKNDSILYVSNGTGWWGPPMRLGSRNEITIINLVPKQIDIANIPHETPKENELNLEKVLFEPSVINKPKLSHLKEEANL